jgi:hypothetical protein
LGEAVPVLGQRGNAAPLILFTYCIFFVPVYFCPSSSLFFHDLPPLGCYIFIFVCYLHIPVIFIFQSCSYVHYQPNSTKKLLLRKLEKNLFH